MTLLIVVSNKAALAVFPFPATLTVLHYISVWASMLAARYCGAFEPLQDLPPQHRTAYRCCVVTWSLANALSNVSLGKNSVGFYQLVKVH